MSARRDRAEVRLAALEAEYRRILIQALEVCASGQWGLLGAPAGPDKALLERHQPACLPDLMSLADEITTHRTALGYSDAFTLHERLMVERRRVDANAVGEPGRASLWLSELTTA